MAVTVLSALDGEAERIAKLADVDRAAEIERCARELGLPVGTLERRVALHRGESRVPDNEELGRRLARLMFLLGGPERDAAVAAIDEALRSAGRDWSYLSRLVGVAEAGPAVSEDARSWIEGGEAILRHEGLREHEREFVLDMVDRFNTQSWFEPSEKQTKWFVALYRRYVRK